MSSWEETFRKVGALWVHNGNPEYPHALLASGNHSSGFFNGSRVIENPALLEEAVRSLAELWRIGYGFGPHIERVVGPAFGAITLAHELGRELGVKTGFTEPVEEWVEKRMLLRRFTMKPGEVVLVVEDVITTGGTTQETIAELETHGAVVASAICVLLNRSGKENLDGRHIIALVNHPMPVWTTTECPLCEQGSMPIRPKEAWGALSAN